MMFNKFAVFALLAVIVLVVPAIGHPIKDDVASEIEETATEVKHRIHGWLKNVQTKIAKHEENCTHGGVIRWVKNKLGLTKKATPETSSTTTTTTTTEETDYSGSYVPITSVVSPEEPGEGYAAGPDDDVTILDDASATETESYSGNESGDVAPTYSSVADNAVDQVYPEIDIRGKF